MWKRILEPLRKKLKGENGVRLVMLLGIAGLALILLSGFLPDKAEKQTDAASVQSAETASQEHDKGSEQAIHEGKYMYIPVSTSKY